MKYKIDVTKLRDSNIHVEGWALPKNLKEKPRFQIFDSNNKLIDAEITYTLREDLVQVFKLNIDEKPNFGFTVVFPYDEEEIYTFNILFDNSLKSEKLSKEIVLKQNSLEYKKHKFLYSFITLDNITNGIKFLFTEGPSAFVKKIKSKFEGKEFEYDYNEWYDKTKIKKDELENQKNIVFKYRPLFSIVIPVYDTPDTFLKLLLDSIFNQTYDNFEVCIADATNYTDNSTHHNNPKNIFEKYQKIHNNLIVKYLNKNEGISENTNEAISLAHGEYIVLCDHDDELCLNALYECTKILNENVNVNIIYSDEDKIDMTSQTYFEPHFKPDFNLDLLLSVNYFCHLFVVKKSLLDSISIDGKTYERKEYDGAQDYDLFLRLVNKLLPHNTKSIFHIPKVLYHWRCHKESTAKKPETKMYAFLAGQNALIDFYKNSKINFPKIEKVETGVSLGFYHTIFNVDNEEWITVVIPNKDHIEDLDTCIKSLLKGSYKKLKFVIVENNSTDSKTFDFYKKIEKENENIKVVYWKEDFNYSAINNYGVQFVNTEYILFLNNDIEMKSKNSIKEMYSYIVRDDVGIVGAKLLYSDETIQHAGVVIGFGGIAGHTFIGTYDKENAYMHRNQAVCDYSAVTAACLLTKKSIFNKVGGFSEDLKVAFNDIDFCLKVRQLDKLVVYNPYAEFYHYESKSRGLEDTVEKVERFNSEILKFGLKWPDILKNGDPYYNPNLTLRKSNYALRDLRYEQIGEPFPLDLSIEKRIKEAKNHKR